MEGTVVDCSQGKHHGITACIQCTVESNEWHREWHPPDCMGSADWDLF